MKVFKLHLIFFLIVFSSCEQRENIKGAEKQINKAISNLHPGSAANSDFNESFNFDDSIDFRKAIRLDTTFSVKNESVTIFVTVEFDTTKPMIIPEKFVGIHGMTSFHVHESYSKVRIHNADKLIIDTVLTKRSFASEADPTLLQYGNLMFPHIDLINDQININYSLSIPMTDIGIPVTYSFVTS